MRAEGSVGVKEDVQRYTKKETRVGGGHVYPSRYVIEKSCLRVSLVPQQGNENKPADVSTRESMRYDRSGRVLGGLLEYT